MTRTVAMVLETPFPPDSRVEREILALRDAGYRVHMLCAKQTQADPDQEMWEGVTLHRVEARQAQGWQTKGAWKNLTSALSGVENDWAYWISGFIREVQPDVVHVHDLKLLPTVVSVLTKRRKTRLVADLHENYPALVAHLVQQRKGAKRAAQKARFWQALERKLLPSVDEIIVVDPVAKDRLLQDVPGVKAEQITVLQNVVDSDKFLAPDVAEAAPCCDPALFQDRFVLAYVGHVNGPHRGIHTVLEAMALLKPQIPNLLFVAAGAVRERYWEQTLKPLVDAHQLQDMVHFTGSCSEEAFAPVIKRSAVCLCPHTKTELTDTTFPNKVFLYHLFQKPLVSSNCDPLVRYVKESEGGVVFESENAQSLAEVILKLYQNPDLQAQLGAAGALAVLTRYCWAVEKQALLTAYARLRYDKGVPGSQTGPTGPRQPEDALTR